MSISAPSKSRLRRSMVSPHLQFASVRERAKPTDVHPLRQPHSLCICRRNRAPSISQQVALISPTAYRTPPFVGRLLPTPAPSLATKALCLQQAPPLSHGRQRAYLRKATISLTTLPSGAVRPAQEPAAAPGGGSAYSAQERMPSGANARAAPMALRQTSPISSPALAGRHFRRRSARVRPPAVFHRLPRVQPRALRGLQASLS